MENYETTCKFHANGFIELDSCKMWDIKVGGKYYITKNSSAIVAFTVNSDNIEKEGFRITYLNVDKEGLINLEELYNQILMILK